VLKKTLKKLSNIFYSSNRSHDCSKGDYIVKTKLFYATVITFYFFLFVASTLSHATEEKWDGYVEFMAKPGTARNLGQADLLVPLWQDRNDLTFFNGKGMFDTDSNSEFNLGLGHRHLFNGLIVGGYAFYDQRRSESGNIFKQVMAGFEFMSKDWDFRFNAYVPESAIESLSGDNGKVINEETYTKTKTLDNINTVAKGTFLRTEYVHDLQNARTAINNIHAGSQASVQTRRTTTTTTGDQIIQEEKTLPGLDGEIGFRLPLEKFIPQTNNLLTEWAEDTRIYAGGYHFFGSDGFESVTGVRTRLEARLFDLPFLGNGSRVMAGIEAQYDKPRGTQVFGMASLRIPFGVVSKKKQPKLHGLARRMQEPIIRDVDIVTDRKNGVQAFSKNEINDVVIAVVPTDEETRLMGTSRWSRAAPGLEVTYHTVQEIETIEQLNEFQKNIVKLRKDLPDNSKFASLVDQNHIVIIADGIINTTNYTNKPFIPVNTQTYTAKGSKFKFYFDDVKTAPDGTYIKRIGYLNEDSTYRMSVTDIPFFMQPGTHVNGFNINRNNGSETVIRLLGGVSGSNIITNSMIRGGSNGVEIPHNINLIADNIIVTGNDLTGLLFEAYRGPQRAPGSIRKSEISNSSIGGNGAGVETDKRNYVNFTNVEILNNTRYGLQATGSNIVMRDSKIFGNGLYDIFARTNTTGLFENNLFGDGDTSRVIVFNERRLSMGGMLTPDLTFNNNIFIPGFGNIFNEVDRFLIFEGSGFTPPYTGAHYGPVAVKGTGNIVRPDSNYDVDNEGERPLTNEIARGSNEEIWINFTD
jgi:hypothetical protein